MKHVIKQDFFTKLILDEVREIEFDKPFVGKITLQRVFDPRFDCYVVLIKVNGHEIL